MAASSSSSHFFPQRKKITKRKRSEAEANNGNINVTSDLVQGHTKPNQMKQVFTKPACGKGNLLIKKAKKPPTARKPTVKKEKDLQKPVNEKNLISSPIIKNYDINNVPIANEEQGKFRI